VEAQRQPPTPATPAAPQPEAQPQTSPPPPVPDQYSYSSGGRRDPFISLVNRGTDLRASGKRPAGLPGVMIGEVSLKGIVRSHNTFIAMLLAPDGKTYVVQSNARLLDGTVKAISAESVLFAQDVTDPLSLVKEREVRKTLRPMEDMK
jgi:hypothetical protein